MFFVCNVGISQYKPTPISRRTQNTDAPSRAGDGKRITSQITLHHGEFLQFYKFNYNDLHLLLFFRKMIV
jgi:hypothetical protein